jgi:peptide deformylase
VTAYAIRTFGDPVLRQRAPEVTELNGDLVHLVDAMRVAMHDAHGVGLAAPQVGVQKRLYIYDVDELTERGATAPGPGVLVNPEIISMDGEWSYEEGCLSVPGMMFELVRPNRVAVRGLDLDGQEVVLEGDELMGRMIQHEVDHLDGILVLDRVDPETRKAALRELRTRAFDAHPVGGDHRL